MSNNDLLTTWTFYRVSFHISFLVWDRVGEDGVDPVWNNVLMGFMSQTASTWMPGPERFQWNTPLSPGNQWYSAGVSVVLMLWLNGIYAVRLNYKSSVLKTSNETKGGMLNMLNILDLQIFGGWCIGNLLLTTIKGPEAWLWFTKTVSNSPNCSDTRSVRPGNVSVRTDTWVLSVPSHCGHWERHPTPADSDGAAKQM